MIWRDKISTVASGINAQSMYNTARTTTPSNFQLMVFNQAQDWLCMNRAWRDLSVTTQLSLDSDSCITMPDDFGCIAYVYCDPTAQNYPAIFFHLNHIDPGRRYTRTVTIDSTTGIRTIKFCFPQSSTLGNPYIVYSKALDDITQADIDDDIKYSFFPINTILVVAKLIMYRYYGQSANYDYSTIMNDVNMELNSLSRYAISNNAPLDLTPHDSNGQKIYICGAAQDGSSVFNQRSIYPNSTLLLGH